MIQSHHAIKLFKRDCLIVCLIVVAPLLNGLYAQDYKFRQYGINEGICHSFVYTVNQDRLGYIWLGTGEGLCRFDGLNFNGEVTSDSLPRSFAKKSYRDSTGNLWFGHNDGSITHYDGKSFTIITTPEEIRSTINDIAVDPAGNIVFLTQKDGLIVVDRAHRARVIEDPFRGMLLSSIAFSGTSRVLVGAYNGLYLFEQAGTGDSLSLISKVNEIPSTRITAIMKNKKGDCWIGTQDNGLYMMQFDKDGNGNYSVSSPAAGILPERCNIRSVATDRKGHLWLSTRGDGIYRMELNQDGPEFSGMVHFDQENGLGSMNIEEVFEDIEGNIWIATYGNGLSALFDDAFTFYHYDSRLGRSVFSVYSDEENLWLGGTGTVMRIGQGIEGNTRLYGRGNGLPADRITALRTDHDGTLWIGTETSGLYRMDPGRGRATRYHYSENSLENTVNRITESEGVLWVATNNGVLEIDHATGSITRLSTSDGLPHNSISDVFADSKGNVWIATRTNGLRSVNTALRYRISGSSILEFVSITEDRYGNLWAATDNNGVFKFLEDTLEYFSTADGLKSASCYSIGTDANGNIWVGHRLGLSKIDPDRETITTYGPDDGIEGDCLPNALTSTPNGEMVFGTSNGIVKYDSREERIGENPPLLNITSIQINDVETRIGAPISLPYGRYKLRVEFQGLDYRSPESVRYQYRLDGYDDWSDPDARSYAQYPRLEDGDYTFMVRACNEEGICNDQPVTFSLHIRLPVWKTWWFISLSVLVLVISVYLIIKFRERKQKQFQELLQSRLDERTKEVVMQKEEIEVKNKDITDSINYAQRIQASILPPISRLHDTFSGSFVFYQPRDIVSGDFYWYDRFGKDRFVIVCADSTGHGVPGAFMSMIGTTLIKDIVSRMEVDSPASLLKILDKEIMSALNQNIEAEQSNDGMDIIVSEINLKNNHVKISSAMRPMIVYQNGEQIYVRGSRNSVGGQYESEGKEFETNEFQLRKGDKLYMFSDGYPDQFGGPLGKKFKMVRLKNMLRDIQEKSMEEQYHYVKNNFELWREDHEQVDDVLFMGIEI